ncbi:MAG TPA: hypothetical protein VM925_36145 [Labilithrix sp.]|nr:hypothetical protein [Labilithrix sp.]
MEDTSVITPMTFPRELSGTHMIESFSSDCPLGSLAPSFEKEDRYAARALDLFQKASDLEPVHVGHHDIQQDQR